MLLLNLRMPKGVFWNDWRTAFYKESKSKNHYNKKKARVKVGKAGNPRKIDHSMTLNVFSQGLWPRLHQDASRLQRDLFKGRMFTRESEGNGQSEREIPKRSKDIDISVCLSYKEKIKPHYLFLSFLPTLSTTHVLTHITEKAAKSFCSGKPLTITLQTQ